MDQEGAFQIVVFEIPTSLIILTGNTPEAYNVDNPLQAAGAARGTESDDTRTTE